MSEPPKTCGPCAINNMAAEDIRIAAAAEGERIDVRHDPEVCRGGGCKCTHGAPETPETTTEVPAELIKVAMDAYDVWSTGHIHRDMPHVLAAVLSAYDAAKEREVRAKVAEEMRRMAEGRRFYADGNPPGDSRTWLEVEAHTFNSAAKVAEGDVGTVLALLPTLMWNDAETAHARGEQP